MNSTQSLKDKNILALEAEYTKRLSKSASIVLTNDDHTTILDKLSPKHKGGFNILLAESGLEFTSQDFSKFVEKKMVDGFSNLVFLIGPPLGWQESDYKKADFVLSLSKLTFPYQLTRVILLEQIYRAYSIINNTPYHK